MACLYTKGQSTQPRSQGVAVGIDVLPIITRLYDDEHTGLAFTGRYKLKENWFISGEAGYEKTDFSKKEFDYNSDGTFIKAGFDYNLFEVEEAGNNDNILLGFRYGYGWQTHNSGRFTITDAYWGDYTGVLGSNSVNSHWIELTFGLRTEIIKNIYMGWSIRLKQLMTAQHKGILEPYAIPGFGKFDNKTNLGFTYTIEYQLPFGKQKKQSKP